MKIARVWGSMRRARWLAATLALLFVSMMPALVSAQDEPTVEIFGLPGSLRAAVAQEFSTYLVDSQGNTFALVGRTAAIEAQIITLRDAGQNARVWGTLFVEGRLSNLPEIVVDSVIGAPTTTQPTPTPTPQRGTTATVNFPNVNVRSGPSTAYPAIGSAVQNTICDAIGRNGDASWLQLVCPAVTGWMSTPLLVVAGSLVDLPVIAVGPPPASPTPTPVQFPDWRASYFTNRDLSGAASLVRNEATLDFDWGFGSPASGIPVDNFSARFERTLSFAPGTYEIAVTVDDGARVWVNDELVIDDWRESSVRRLSTMRALAGAVRLRVEYFEAYNMASLRFSTVLQPAAPPTPPPGASELPLRTDEWAAAYWNNMNLGGSPLMARYEGRGSAPLDVNWGNGSPAPGLINVDNFSARWRGRFNFAAGDITFTARADDGIRVWIDDIIIIDAWRDGHQDLSNTFRRLGGGLHTITVEYYENTGTALAQVSWNRANNGGGGGGSGGNDGSGIIRDE